MQNKLIELISIPLKIESLNQINSWHWSKKNKYSKIWEEHIWAALNGKLKKATSRMRIKVTSYRKRLLDTDNLIGGFKGGRDALKRLGLIVDDSPKWCEVQYVQYITKGNPLTTIELIPWN